MKLASFGNFQIGQVDNPSVENKGGFEFASGMDPFSEPGVIKAALAMADVTLTEGLTQTKTIAQMVEYISDDVVGILAAHGDDVWISVSGIVFEGSTTFTKLFSGTKGTILGLAVFNGYLFYATATNIGRITLGSFDDQDDDFIDTGVEDSPYHPMVVQGGTLKVGNGRYVGSIDEDSTFTAQALKLPVGYVVKTMAAHFDRLFVGANEGQAAANVSSQKATIFEWRGILPATGAALPDVIYTLNTQGIHVLVSNGTDLFAFPGWDGAAWVYTGAGFAKFRDIFPDKTALMGTAGQLIEMFPYSATAYEGSLLVSGTFDNQHGIFQIKDGRVTQLLVPSFVTPGETVSSETRSTPMVASVWLDTIFFSTKKTVSGTSTYYFQYLSTNRQDDAMVRTLWHRLGTDQFKRIAGIKLNLKPMAADTAVSVAYRTGRTDSFTAAPYTITSANQDQPIMFTVRPRASEIQFNFTFTTSTTKTPELLSYDILFETLNTSR
jgi:hypothetical protein